MYPSSQQDKKSSAISSITLMSSNKLGMDVGFKCLDIFLRMSMVKLRIAYTLENDGKTYIYIKAYISA